MVGRAAFQKYVNTHNLDFLFLFFMLIVARTFKLVICSSSLSLILSDDYLLLFHFLCLGAHVILAFQMKLEFFQYSFCFLSKNKNLKEPNALHVQGIK